MTAMRSPDELLASALAVIDFAFTTPAVYRRKSSWGLAVRHKYAKEMAPLFSGGHDSICACHVASQHPKFGGKVWHINTGIGAKRTREHVEGVCRELGWKLVVLRSSQTYEQFVRERGFPGPGRHEWVYNRLKDRCIRNIVKGKRVALVTGCRKAESTRRMGHVEPLKIGEERGNGEVRERNRYWSAPCHDWTTEEQATYMDEHELPVNPVKLALGMSGECFCGAFAAPGELDRIRYHCPDVAEEIDRLTVIAEEIGVHATWGTRPPDEPKGIAVAESGPLCSTCEHRAAAAGVVFAK